MTKLPSNQQIQEQAKDRFQLVLCERDSELLAEHQPLIFAEVQKLIQSGASAKDVKFWALQVVDSEPLIIQRIYNAARFISEGGTPE